jgi:hypothetical protein
MTIFEDILVMNIKMKQVKAILMACITAALSALLAQSCCTKAPEKEFVIYDCLFYPGKPDLSADGLEKIKLVYEHRLLTDGAIDMDKINELIKEANEAGIKVISTDIESWYWGDKYTGAAIRDSLDKIYTAFRAGIEGVSLGNYGVPMGTLNIARYVEDMEGKTEEELHAALMDNNVRLEAGEVADVLYPCLYAYGPDVDQWIRDLETTVEYARKHYPDKKIVAYLWSQYYDWKTSPYYMQFITEENFLKMLEAAYERLDGVILWAHGRDADNKTKVNWEDPRVQAIYRAIKSFVSRHGISEKYR